jgi:hypothetical protein
MTPEQRIGQAKKAVAAQRRRPLLGEEQKAKRQAAKRPNGRRWNSSLSVFAEYLVGCALDAIESPRIEWYHYDVSYREKLIEVKASAYGQSWPQTRLSTISFDIRWRRGWDGETNSSCNGPASCADCYIFCLFVDRDLENRENCVMTDVKRWKFYVVAAADLNRCLGMQNWVALKSIEKIATSVTFDGIRGEVDGLIAAGQLD